MFNFQQMMGAAKTNMGTARANSKKAWAEERGKWKQGGSVEMPGKEEEEEPKRESKFSLFGKKAKVNALRNPRTSYSEE